MFIIFALVVLSTEIQPNPSPSNICTVTPKQEVAILLTIGNYKDAKAD